MADGKETLDDLRGPVTGIEPVFPSIPLPDGKLFAVTVQLALEAWMGGNVTGSTLGSGLSAEAIAKGVPDYATISAQEYGGRTGLWRILDTLGEYGVPASCSVSGLAGEVWPELVKAIADSGHEIVGHGWSQDRAMNDMDEEEDYDVITRSSDMFEKLTGVRPTGWSSHGCRRGRYTVLNLMKTGYTYTNDFRDADVPYIVAELGDKKLVAMPRTDEINDMFIVRRNGNSPGIYVDFFKRAFDQLYKEGEKGKPKFMSCVAHGILFGRPWGIAALGECLAYAKQCDEVWLPTRREAAEYYLKVLTDH